MRCLRPEVGPAGPTFSFSNQEHFYEPKNTKAISDLYKSVTQSYLGNQYLYGKHNLFAVVISFRYLLNKEDFIVFKKKLCYLIKLFAQKTTPNKKNKLLYAMGFPENWMNISRYKI